MADYHVGSCSCPVGCCDCGPASPARTSQYLLTRTPWELYGAREFKTVLRQLNISLTILSKLGQRYHIVCDAIKKHIIYVEETRDLRFKQQERMNKQYEKQRLKQLNILKKKSKPTKKKKKRK